MAPSTYHKAKFRLSRLLNLKFMLKSHEEKRPDFDEESEIGDQNKERKKPNQIKELNYIPNYPERDLQSFKSRKQG
jgi:hypothetical protein